MELEEDKKGRKVNGVGEGENGRGTNRDE